MLCLLIHFYWCKLQSLVAKGAWGVGIIAVGVCVGGVYVRLQMIPQSVKNPIRVKICICFLSTFLDLHEYIILDRNASKFCLLWCHSPTVIKWQPLGRLLAISINCFLWCIDFWSSFRNTGVSLLPIRLLHMFRPTTHTLSLSSSLMCSYVFSCILHRCTNLMHISSFQYIANVLSYKLVWTSEKEPYKRREL